MIYYHRKKEGKVQIYELEDNARFIFVNSHSDYR